MLASFRQVLERTGMAVKDRKQFGVGISISLDKLLCAVGEVPEELCCIGNRFGIDVAVCCLDECQRQDKEFADVLRELWSCGLRVTCLDFSMLEEVLEYCQENGIHNVLIYKNGEKGSLRMQTWERDKFLERKISIPVSIF